MERIIIEVEDTTAQRWKEVPSAIKSELEKSFEKQINGVTEGIKKTQFKLLLDKISDEAEKNGLTEEILQQLLSEK